MPSGMCALRNRHPNPWSDISNYELCPPSFKLIATVSFERKSKIQDKENLR